MLQKYPLISKENKTNKSLWMRQNIKSIIIVSSRHSPCSGFFCQNPQTSGQHKEMKLSSYLEKGVTSAGTPLDHGWHDRYYITNVRSFRVARTHSFYLLIYRMRSQKSKVSVCSQSLLRIQHTKKQTLHECKRIPSL